MSPEDATIARDLRRMLDKRALDATMAVISAVKGHVIVSGTLKIARSQPNADLKAEMEIFHRQALRHGREIRSVNFECRLILPPKKQTHLQEATPKVDDPQPAPGVIPSTHHLPGQHH